MFYFYIKIYVLWQYLDGSSYISWENVLVFVPVFFLLLW